MLDEMSAQDRAKIIAAYYAAGLVEDGMRVGLGTGSTAAWLVKFLGIRKRLEGLDLLAVSTSEATEALALKMQIPTATLETAGWLDLTIDGADEFDPFLSLIKGGGGALLREKIVATASERMVVMADESKAVEKLGEYPLPVEIVTFGWTATETMIADLLEDLPVAGRRIARRETDGMPFVTDEGHYILDLHLEEIGDVDALTAGLARIPGVVETGLFVDIAESVVTGLFSGELRIVHQNADAEEFDVLDTERLETFITLSAA